MCCSCSAIATIGFATLYHLAEKLVALLHQPHTEKGFEAFYGSNHRVGKLVVVNIASISIHANIANMAETQHSQHG